MPNFTAVDKELLRQAFSLAHQACEDNKYPAKTRAKFKAIATLIWRAHGEKGANPPAGVGAALIARTSLESQATRDDRILCEMRDGDR
jgi:hypothetical protein